MPLSNSLQSQAFGAPSHHSWSSSPTHLASNPSEDTQVSEVLCKAYSSGRQCAMEDKGGCPNIHDPNVRRDSLSKIWAKRDKIYAQRNSVSRAIHSNQVNYSKKSGAEKTTVKETNQGSGKNSQQSNKTDARINIAKKAGQDTRVKTRFTLDSNRRPNSTTGSLIGNIKNQHAIKSSSKDITVNSRKKCDSITNNPSQKLCYFFLRGRCKFGEKCRNVHNRELDNKHFTEKRAVSVTTPGISSSESIPATHSPAATSFKVKVPQRTHVNQSVKAYRKPADVNPSQREPAQYNTTVKQDTPQSLDQDGTKVKVVGEPKAVSWAQVLSDDISPRPEPEAPHDESNKQEGWSEKTERLAWAKRNFGPDVANKHVLSYINDNSVPAKILESGPRKSRKKNNFEYFVFLPAEIRNKIWSYVLDRDAFQCSIQLRYDFEINGTYHNTRFIPRNVPPRLLLVNGESRDLALGHFELTFATNSSAPRCYFSYKTDRLSIQTANSKELSLITKTLLPRDIRRIQRLVLPLRDCVLNGEEFAHSLRRFPRLRKLWLLVGKGLEDERYTQDPEKTLHKVDRWVRPVWQEYWPKKDLPMIQLEIIDALKAKWLGIDQLFWG